MPVWRHPKENWGFILSAMDRIGLTGSGFGRLRLLNLSALSKMIEGSLIADVIAVIGSIDIVLGEVDR